MSKRNKKPPYSLPASSDLSVTIFFTLVLLAVVYLCFYYSRIWGVNFIKALAPRFVVLPPVSVIFQNIQLSFQGYPSGYLRSFLGYAIFVLMSVSFISMGRMVFYFIFEFKHQENRGEPISFFEKASLYYILGASAVSLLWLGLGSVGALNTAVAGAVGLTGLAGLFVELRPIKSSLGNGQLRVFKENLFLNFKQISFGEKVLGGILFLTLIFLSANAVRSQSYIDTLFVNIALPSLFINEGRITTWPNHIHSFLPLNLEMLVMWALLLKSEMAATLLIWGFLLALVFLIFGFIKRYTNRLVALSTILIIISASLVVHSSIMIKTDFPPALFIFAHYYALIEMLNRRALAPQDARRWSILAGVLCGAAIGIKLIALPVALFSSVLILGNDLYYYKKRQGSLGFLLSPCLAGMAVMTAPWLLRAFLETGNPLYPYFSNLIGTELIKPWHGSIRGDISIAHYGWAGLKEVFQGIWLLGYESKTHPVPPSWGPSLLFILTGGLFFKNSYPIGARLCMGLALFTWIFFLFFALDPRYYIGFLIFLFSVPYALNLNIILKGKFANIYQFIIKTGTVLYFLQMFALVNTWNLLHGCLATGLEGYSVGNYPTNEAAANNMQWIYHVINTRTKEDETFLSAVLPMAYGIERKMFVSSEIDKNLLVELAEQSSDETVLRDKIRNLGVDHILFNLSHIENPPPQFKPQASDVEKIKLLILKHMKLRFAVPDKSVLWYSFSEPGGEAYPAITLNGRDAEKFPIMFLSQAWSEITAGNVQLGAEMAQTAVQVPMRQAVKDYAYNILSAVQKIKDERR